MKAETLICHLESLWHDLKNAVHQHFPSNLAVLEICLKGKKDNGKAHIDIFEATQICISVESYKIKNHILICFNLMLQYCKSNI